MDTASEWGPGRPQGSSAAAAAQLRWPAHGRPHCGATLRAQVSLRQRAQGPAHPTSAPAAGSKRDPAKMSHSHPAGLLAAYNSLTDKHLTGYFNNTRIRRHLLRSGLITRSGRILSEKEYKLNIMKRDHQKYIRDCLAQAIFHKVLDMERYHQLEIKKKLETLARKERIQRFKGEPTRWSIENNMPILSPHPPVGPKTNRGHSVLIDEGHSSPVTLTAPRPYTAPGNMQPPIRLKPLPSNPAVGTVPKITSGSRSKTSLLENEAPFPIGGKKAVMKFKNSMDNSQGVNRYQLPNINNYMMPIPPAPPPPSGRIIRENRLESWRRRRFRPTTAPDGLDPLFTRSSDDHLVRLNDHVDGCAVRLLSRHSFSVYGLFSLTTWTTVPVWSSHNLYFTPFSDRHESNAVLLSQLSGKRGRRDLPTMWEDIKTVSSSSSRSRPCSSCSEDESAPGDREAHTENGLNRRDRSPSSQELSESDEPGKSHLPIEDYLEVEIEDQEIVTADVETKPLPTEECLENVLEEETEKGTQVVAEGLSEKSREHVSTEEKEKDKSRLWEGSTAKVKDKKAGPHRVEKDVGQTVAEAVEPGSHRHYDTESGVSSTNEEKHSRKLEIDTGAAPHRNFVLEEQATLSSDTESKQGASEVYTLEKKAAVAGDELPQHGDADTRKEKGGAAQWGKAVGVNEVPLGEGKPTAPALIGRFTEEREIPRGIASGAEAEAEGDPRLDKEESSPRGKEATRAAGGLKEDEAPEEPVLLPTVLETEKVAAEEARGSQKAVLASEAAALDSERTQEAAAMRETVTQGKREAERGAAVSAAGSEKPEVNSEEQASTALEDLGAAGEAASEGEGGSEEAVLGGEEPAEEREAAMGPGTPLSSSTWEKAEAAPTGLSEGSLEELCKEDAEREEIGTEAESNKEDDKKEMLPEELGVARERTKAERPESPLEETESEREEVTRANARPGEDILEEEHKFKGEEPETVKEVRSEEETQVSQNERECDAEGEAATGPLELTDDAGPQGGDSLREREGAMFEAAPGYEESLENTTALRKQEGGESPREARDREHKGRAELLPRENGAASGQDQGPGPDGEGVSGAPETELAGRGQAPEAMIAAPSGAQERAAKDQDGLAGLEGGDEEGPLQRQQGAGVTAMTQEDVSEEDSVTAEKLSEEAMDEEADKECSRGTGVRRNGDTEGDGSLQGGAVVAEEDLHQGEEAAGTAAEKREVLADLKTAEGKTEANKASSLSDVAGKETWHKVEELLGKPAAAEKVVAGERALSREEVRAVEEVTGTWAPEAEVGAPREPSGPGGQAPQLGQDPEGGGAATTQRAEAVGEEPGPGSGDQGQELGAGEEFSPGVSRGRKSEPRGESLQGAQTLPVKPDYTESQERQERTVQREKEHVQTQRSP
ncbi:glutamate-rich protein 3 [Leptonychotes weddellii]|uniref:Glutamate-rich protein 3 n=1 Tax=Leptonychotes weddellii TaxID=9713 RepID=A0A7F8Q7I1_LEPWE|nr:glutamate-rich protein 3 [Leptonychotes weddellii]